MAQFDCRVGDKLVATHEMDCTFGNGKDFTISVGETFIIDKIEKGLVFLNPEKQGVAYDFLKVPLVNIKRGFDLQQSPPVIACVKNGNI